MSCPLCGLSCIIYCSDATCWFSRLAAA